MKQLISILVFATLICSNSAFAAKKPVEIKARTISSKSEKKMKWNQVCRDLLDVSVKSTLKLEKAVNKNKKISQTIIEEKVQNELMVVQLNAWVCALSTKGRKAVMAEELFLKDFSRMIKSKRL